MDYTIRKAEEEDFPVILQLFKDFAAFEKLPEKMVNTVDRMKQEKHYFNCFLAESENGEILGFVSYFFCYYTWIGKSLYMDDLYVKPEHRGRSIGTALVNTIIDFARASGCHKLRWQVSGWNKPAIDYYKRLGAIIDDVEQNCDLLL